jgi:SpoVK/Ycf46/Vps4 family AAA+-type ATPase
LLLLGIPGCGKTQLAKVLGAATQRETLIFDVRAVQDSYIGSSEKRLRQALAIADSMAPCNLVIDEVEKALSGSSPGSSSSGVMSGIMGTLLSYLSDRRTDVFVMCTSNDVTSLPPEFSRSERFDAMFFVDVPTAGEREQIWTIWLKKYGLPVDKLDHLVAESEDWTGAEIKSACRLAVLRAIPVEQSMLSVVPIIHTAGDLLQRTREWASSRCLSAAKPARYSLPTKLKALPQPAGKRRVKV